MPTPGKLSMSRCASSKTGTGNTAGPALKLKILSVIDLLLLKSRSQSFSRHLRHRRAWYEAFGFNHQPVGPTGNHHRLLPVETAQRCVHDLFRCLNRAHRRTIDLRGSEEVSLSNTGTQRHHMNSMQAILFGNCLRKRQHKRLCRCVRRHERNSLKSRGRSDVDDRAALALAHRAEKTMRQVDQCPHVQLNDLELAIKIESRKVAHRAEAGVVDEHVDFELAFLRLFEQLRPGAGVLQIERKILCANTRQTSELVAESDQFVF